jgi:hypothetical protein
MTYKYIINKIKNNKKDTIYWIIILFLFSLLFYKFAFYIHYELSDFGRELYIPSEIVNGKVLYKDLLNIFAPMSYYFNALFIRILGNSFNTFFLISAFLSVMILIPFYNIVKKYVNKEIVLSSIILIFFTCIFYVSANHWLAPYSYAILYANVFILWAIFFVLKYIESNNRRYIYYSAFFYGISLSCKYDYILFLIVILICLFHKRENIKIYINSILIALVFPLFALIICFINGNTISTLYNSLTYMVKLVMSEHNLFYFEWCGIKPGPIMFNNLVIEDKMNIRFFWIGYTAFITLLFYIIRKYDFKYIILNLSIILINIKYITFVNLSNYGTYSFPLLYLNLIIFIFNIYNQIRNEKFSEIYKKIIVIVVILINLFLAIFYFNHICVQHSKYKKVETPKGDIYINGKGYNNFLQMQNFINENLNEGDQILIIPEGLIYNYITGKESDGYMYNMLPSDFDIFGDKYYLNRLKQKNIKYIVVTSVWYGFYNAETFKTSFGKNIYENYILQEYELCDTFINDYSDIYDKTEFLVFRKK